MHLNPLNRSQASINTTFLSHSIERPLLPEENNGFQVEESLLLQEKILTSIQSEKIQLFFQKCGFNHDPKQDQKLWIDFLFKHLMDDCSNIHWHSLDHHFLLTLQDSKGMNIFFAAIREGNEGCVQALTHALNQDLLISLKDTSRRTALHIAAIYGQDHLIDALTKNGLTNCYDEDCEKLIPLHWAIHEGHLKTTEKLLTMTSLGRHWSLSHTFKVPILALAIASGYEDILSLILKSNHFQEINLLNTIFPWGTVLHFAIHCNQSFMLKHLLCAQYQNTQLLMELKDPVERVPLQLAAFLGDLFAINLLITKGAYLHQGEGSQIGTALHLAVAGEKPEAVSLLLTLGADFSKTDHLGRTALALINEKTSLSPAVKRCKNILENYQKFKRLEKINPANFKERAPFNVIFEGKCDRKDVFIKAIQALEAKKIIPGVRRVSGLGMGSVIATLLSIGYPSSKLKELPFDSLTTFFEHHQTDLSNEMLKQLKTLYSHVKKGSSYTDMDLTSSLCDEVVLKQKLEEWIDDYTTTSHLTFGELSHKVHLNSEYKHLHLSVFSLKMCQVISINSEDLRFKEFIISDVLAASLTLPGIFKPKVLRCKNHQGTFYNDQIYGELIAPFLEDSLVDLFDDHSYQEDPYFQGKQTNYRTLSLQMHDELDESLPSLESQDLLHDFLKIYTTSSKKPLASSFSRGRAKLFSFSKASLENEETVTASIQQQFKELFLTAEEIPLRKTVTLTKGLQESLMPWKYDLFLKAAISPLRVSQEKRTLFFSTAPQPILSFTGRSQELKAIEEAFKVSSKVAIVGLGGIGKSTLSIKYASTLQEYAFIHFIKAKSRDAIMQGATELAGLLHLEGSTQQELLTQLKIKLRQMTNRYLLIIDGLDDESYFKEINDYIPATEQSKILITTRLGSDAQAKGFRIFPLSSFSPEEAIHYVLNSSLSSDEKEKKVAEALCKSVGYLPLALSHITRYLEQNKISLCKYDELFQKYQLKVPKKTELNLPDEETSILITWNISIEAIKKMEEGDLAFHLIQLISMLGEADIPFDLLMVWLREFYPKKDERCLKEAIKLLKDYSFLEEKMRNKDNSSFYQVHSLVQKVIANHLSTLEKKGVFQIISAILNQSIGLLRAPYHDRGWSLNNKLNQIYQIHAFNLSAMEEFDQTFQGENKAKFLCNLAWIHLQRSFSDEALICINQAIEMGISLGDESLMMAEFYHLKAVILSRIGEYKIPSQSQLIFTEGDIINQKSLEIRKKFLQEESPYVLENYDLCITFLKKLEKKEEAVKLLKKVLEIKRRVLGEDAASTRKSYEILVKLLLKLEQKELLLEISQTILASRKQNNTLKFDNMATLLYTYIAGVFWDLKRREEALQITKEFLDFREQPYQKEHPYGKECYAAELAIFHELKEREDAVEILKQVEEKVGNKLRVTGDWFSLQYELNLESLEALGKKEEALNFVLGILETTEKSLGENHQGLKFFEETALRILYELEKQEEIVKFAKKVLDKRGRGLTPYYGDTWNWYAIVLISLHELGRTEEITAFLEEILENHKTVVTKGYQAEALNDCTAVTNILIQFEKLEEALTFIQKELLNHQEKTEENLKYIFRLNIIFNNLKQGIPNFLSS
ncbi:ankyrin repeat domain-containing protein [Rhabdochlamydiaceae symbiont of Dictyostelium giganteum]|uniref:ankyrin repeat domain-containing protein n=1 Tax=Rhabdochlamydiaceae symbiont of Dictyostelium giganteum TaxID=3342349 RepID=UPI00384AF56B